VWEHQQGLTPGFTTKYGVTRLIWYEDYPDIGDAITREKRLKRWRRDWKLRRIEAKRRDPGAVRTAALGPGQPLRGFRNDTPC
jgi:predicted GIY-YIG superfamily endonuclease